MKKNSAFNVVEITVVILLLLVTALFCIPIITKNTKQARIVLGWKKTFAETKSNFEIFNINDINSVKALCSAKMDKDKRDAEIFKIIGPYLAVDSTTQNPELEKYRYKFHTGSVIPKDSQFFMERYAYRESGSIVGFKWLDCKCSETEPCAAIVFDMNGKKNPNKLGKDVFGLYIFKGGIESFGYDMDNEQLRVECTEYGGNGAVCSEYYLRGGKF